MVNGRTRQIFEYKVVLSEVGGVGRGETEGGVEVAENLGDAGEREVVGGVEGVGEATTRQHHAGGPVAVVERDLRVQLEV